MARRQPVGRFEARREFVGDEPTIYAARARRLGLPFARTVDLGPRGAVRPDAAAVRAGKVAMAADADRLTYLAPDEEAMSDTLYALGRYPRARARLAVATPSAIRRALIASGAPKFLREATTRLSRTRPMLSARRTTTRGQLAFAAAIATGLAVGIAVDPSDTLLALNVVASLLFLGVTLLRFVAAAGMPARSARQRVRLASHDADLPVYSVLVPLYREERVVGQLVAALKRIDWPSERLDIKLIVEADDRATRRAAERAASGPPFEVIVVPAGGPRTKPKALAFALPFARGAFVTIYDAEDRPHPAQLREAYAAFERAPGDLACLQAPLVIDNRRASLLARLFALEYSTLFDGLLPMLARFDMPLPLGGTSNHFRRSALEALGGWDPYNVTEDADLGVRLARFGYAAATLRLPTFEEAPTRLMPWLRQRTRWFKGWMQTWLVHHRRPIALARQLGLRGLTGFNLVSLGMIVSAMIHPVYLATLAVLATDPLRFWASDSVVAHAVVDLDLFNLVAGYAAAALLAARTLALRGRGREVIVALLLPLYWLIMSIACYRALGQLVRRPHHWEKTPHRGRRAGAAEPPNRENVQPIRAVRQRRT